jgi:molybdenum cofactor biosynthesis enzyme MoaA
MEQVWITNASPTIQAVVDPLAAACEAGFVPTTVHMVANPAVEEESDEAAAIVDDVVAAHGESATIESQRIDDERDFDAIAEYYRDAVSSAPDDAEVAIDLTPGRKFMAVMAFQAGRQFDADHIFYLYIHSSQYYGRPYPEVPQTAVDLMDFTEVLG